MSLTSCPASGRWQLQKHDASTRGCAANWVCTQPPPDLASAWDGQVWPSARAHSHLLAVMPPGVFPGVDDTEVLRFVAEHASE